MEALIQEARELKQCLLAGYYERAYELAQNIDDELTTQELKKEPVRTTKPNWFDMWPNVIGTINYKHNFISIIGDVNYDERSCL